MFVNSGVESITPIKLLKKVPYAQTSHPKIRIFWQKNNMTDGGVGFGVQLPQSLGSVYMVFRNLHWWNINSTKNIDRASLLRKYEWK